MTYGLNHRQTIRPAILLKPLCIWTYFHEFAWFDWHFELIKGGKNWLNGNIKCSFWYQEEENPFHFENISNIFNSNILWRTLSNSNAMNPSIHTQCSLAVSSQLRAPMAKHRNFEFFNSIELELIEFKMQIYGPDGEWHFE